MYPPKIQVLARAAHWPVVDYGDRFFSVTPTIIRELREKTYLEQWRTALVNKWYHIVLEDHSLLMFSETNRSASFSFIQCPLEVPTFRSYLNNFQLNYTEKNRRKMQEEYEMVMETASLKDHVTPVRFDYDENSYRKGIHPVSHIHIGLNNQIRIGLNRRMTAISFVLFIMRQLYPECWERILNSQEAKFLPTAIRNGCAQIQATHWQNDDRLEFHFS